MDQKKVEKAFGVRKIPGIGWQTVEWHISDGKVVKEIKSEPDIRALILEKFKYQIADLWDDLNG